MGNDNYSEHFSNVRRNRIHVMRLDDTSYTILAATGSSSEPTIPIVAQTAVHSVVFSPCKPPTTNF